jgi:hypothetical protein
MHLAFDFTRNISFAGLVTACFDLIYADRSNDIRSDDPHGGNRLMVDFDYNAAAELFPTRRRAPRREPFKYKRFSQAAAAIRFAIEDLPPECLAGAFLEVDEERYGSADIRRLYESADYPLARRVVRS